MSDWLENLKAGDYVFVQNHNTKRLTTIERLTKTQFVVADTSTRFKRTTGREIGGSSWFSCYLAEATEENIAAFKAQNQRNKLIRMVAETDWRKLSTEQLNEILNIVRKE